MHKFIKLPFYVKLSCTLISVFIVGYLAIAGQTILAPLVLGFLCAIVLLPLAHFLERYLRFRRGLAAISSMILLTLFIASIFTLLGSQLTTMASDWPAFKAQLVDSFSVLQRWISDTFHVNNKDQLDYVNNTMAKSLSTGTTLLGRTILSVGSVVIIFIFTFLYGFFLLYYRRLIVRFLLSLFHANHSVTVQTVLSEVQYIVKKYILGLFLQMAIVSTLAFIAFMLIGVKYALLLALITGVFNVIPYIGIFTAMALASLITFATSSGTHVLFVAGSVLLIHAIDGNYIMPRIVGSKVKLNSLFAMIGIVVGEMMWGIMGMFLAIPIVAILKVVFDRVQELKPWGYLLGDDEDSLMNAEAIVIEDETNEPHHGEERGPNAPGPEKD